jgi:hypothetical protein
MNPVEQGVCLISLHEEACAAGMLLLLVVVCRVGAWLALHSLLGTSASGC